MKKFLFLLVALISFSTFATAQKSRSSSSSSSDNPRAERQIAITTNAGRRTMTGIGLIGSYYVAPQFAVDLGIGTNPIRGVRTGVRARYLFLDDNFSPILGAGFIYQAGEKTLNFNYDQPIENPNGGEPLLEEVIVDVGIKPSTYGQLITGLEYMSDGGFVLGFTLGYRVALNDAIGAAVTVDGEEITFDDELSRIVNKQVGSGISFGLNLGYAF